LTTEDTEIAERRLLGAAPAAAAEEKAFLFSPTSCREFLW
jgi:hypothetical protein